MFTPRAALDPSVTVRGPPDPASSRAWPHGQGRLSQDTAQQRVKTSARAARSLVWVGSVRLNGRHKYHSRSGWEDRGPDQTFGQCRCRCIEPGPALPGNLGTLTTFAEMTAMEHR